MPNITVRQGSFVSPKNQKVYDTLELLAGGKVFITHFLQESEKSFLSLVEDLEKAQKESKGANK